MYYETVVNSAEYEATFHDGNRIIYNLIYRLADIYVQSFVLNDAWFTSIAHSDEVDNPQFGTARNYL